MGTCVYLRSGVILHLELAIFPPPTLGSPDPLAVLCPGASAQSAGALGHLPSFLRVPSPQWPIVPPSLGPGLLPPR